MTRIRLLISSSLALALAGPAMAQDDHSDRTRVVSDNLAAALADTMPKYNPPPPEPEKPEKTPEEQAAEDRKNGIIRLPEVVVHGERPPIFTEREVNTDKGLEQIAVNRYFGGAAQAMNQVAIPIIGKSNEALAMEMWQEDERLRQMADFNDRANMESALGEEEDAKETRELIRDASAREEGPPDTVLHRDNTRD